MLSEFAIIPSLFEEESNPDKKEWEKKITALADGLFPKNDPPCPFLLANLWKGKWEEDVIDKIRNIKTESIRLRCFSLLPKIRKILLDRPRATFKCPDDAGCWTKEAIESARILPITTIFSSFPVNDQSKDHKVLNFDILLDDKFWRNFKTQELVPYDLKKQVSILKTLLTRTDFLCVIYPYITEIDLLKELVRTAKDRPKGFFPPEIDIHIPNHDRNLSQEEKSKSAHKQIDHLFQQLKTSWKNSNGSLNIFYHLRSKIKDRWLIAGKLIQNEDGLYIKQPQWMIYLGHVALHGDDPNDTTSWTLYGQNEANKKHIEYCKKAFTTDVINKKMT